MSTPRAQREEITPPLIAFPICLDADRVRHHECAFPLCLLSILNCYSLRASMCTGRTSRCVCFCLCGGVVHEDAENSARACRRREDRLHRARTVLQLVRTSVRRLCTTVRRIIL